MHFFAFFEGCSALSSDIENLLPKAGFEKSNVNLQTTFRNCSSIVGTPPADILWESSSVEFSHANTFAGCTSLDLTRTPVDWGGSPQTSPNTVYAAQQTADNKFVVTEYVYSDEQAGDAKPIVYQSTYVYDPDFTGKHIRFNVNATSGQTFMISRLVRNDNVTSNTYVDWGDGSLTILKYSDFQKNSEQPPAYVANDVSHTYSESRVFTVTISDTLSRIAFDTSAASGNTKYNANNRTIVGEMDITTDNLTAIGTAGLRYANISAIVGENTVTAIQAYVFDGCSQLSSIDGLKHVTRLNANAYNTGSIKSLSTILFDDPMAAIGSSAFSNAYTNSICFNAMTSAEVKAVPTAVGGTSYQFPWGLKDAVVISCLADDGTTLTSYTVADLK